MSEFINFEDELRKLPELDPPLRDMTCKECPNDKFTIDNYQILTCTECGHPHNFNELM